MRLNRFLALHTSLSRRAADKEIANGNVSVNGQTAQLGVSVTDQDKVMYRGKIISPGKQKITILFNKPAGYVCSKKGQGSHTIYDILPKKFHHLNPVGRLDKNSTGLLLMTNDGELAFNLTHPRHYKKKIYEVNLDKQLEPLHQQMINDHGIMLEDGLSKLLLEKTDDSAQHFRVTMSEGRNRQIRRTFASLGYQITRLHRISMGQYSLGGVIEGKIQII